MDNIPVTVLPAATEVLIVGAGIIGLAHAAMAYDLGYRVTIIDRAHAVNGASIRNFGHGCISAQADDVLELALQGRKRWLSLAERAGFSLLECGTMVLARSEAERGVLEEFAQLSSELGQMKSESEIIDIIGIKALAGLFLPLDIRVDPREAAPNLAQWLSARENVDLLWNTNYFLAEGSSVFTSRGRIEADKIIICPGHDVDQIEPELAQHYGIERCGLQMARAKRERCGVQQLIMPGVLTGTSMLRYGGLAQLSSVPTLREEIASQHPELLDIDANIMFTQAPDGSFFIGDSHDRAAEMSPFLRESTHSILAEEITSIIGSPLKIIERWQGVYASAAQQSYVIHQLSPQAQLIVVTTGIGMTIAHGLAMRTFGVDGLEHG